MSGMTAKEYLEQRTLSRLDAPDISLGDLAAALKMVYNRMWDKVELDQHIVEVHQRMCTSCPHANGDRAWLRNLVTTLVGLIGLVLGYFCKGGGL